MGERVHRMCYLTDGDVPSPNNDGTDVEDPEGHTSVSIIFFLGCTENEDRITAKVQITTPQAPLI